MLSGMLSNGKFLNSLNLPENRKMSPHRATTSLTSGHSFSKLKLNYVPSAAAAIKHEVTQNWEFICATSLTNYSTNKAECGNLRFSRR
jgi:hypothetical protein